MADMNTEAAGAAVDPQDDQYAEPSASNGYVIEIRCTPDGKFAIGVEPMEEEEQEEGQNEENYQSVPSLNAAMKLVREIVANAGEMEDVAAGAGEMNAGYGEG